MFAFITAAVLNVVTIDVIVDPSTSTPSITAGRTATAATPSTLGVSHWRLLAQRRESLTTAFATMEYLTTTCTSYPHRR